jgi:hypothetical protein
VHNGDDSTLSVCDINDPPPKRLNNPAGIVATVVARLVIFSGKTADVQGKQLSMSLSL